METDDRADGPDGADADTDAATGPAGAGSPADASAADAPGAPAVAVPDALVVFTPSGRRGR